MPLSRLLRIAISLPRSVAGALRPRRPTSASRWLLLAVLAGSAAIATARADTVVARIDGATITAEEFRLFLGWHKALVARRFFAQSAVVTPAMWQAPCAGVIPAEVLRDEALRDALATKARLIVYAERGLTRALEFADIQQELADENRRRAAAGASGGDRYGPRRWTLEAFYRNRDAELRMRLREQLRARELPLRDRVAAAEPEAVDRRIDVLVRDCLERANVIIDRAAVAAVPVP